MRVGMSLGFHNPMELSNPNLPSATPVPRTALHSAPAHPKHMLYSIAGLERRSMSVGMCLGFHNPVELSNPNMPNATPVPRTALHLTPAHPKNML